MVVDDNQLTLPGFVDALNSSPLIQILGAFDHDAALDWSGEWADVDVVLLDAADESRAGDQFPGVAVVRRVRERGGRRPLIVLVTSPYLHDGLRHRMAGAGVDFYFLRSDLRSTDALLDVVLHPDRHRRGVPDVTDPNARRALGVDGTSDVESFVGWVEGQGLGPALAGGQGSRSVPRSRRWARLRRDAANAGHIEPRNMTTGGMPLDQPTPSIRQLGRLWQWAARIRRPE